MTINVRDDTALTWKWTQRGNVNYKSGVDISRYFLDILGIIKQQQNSSLSPQLADG